MSKIYKNPYIIITFFILLFSLLYDYQTVLFLRPQSVHYWRQTDCTTQALNYYQHGMQFSKPEMHNLHANGYTNGYCVEELPVIFYFTAFLYKIFGFHEWLFRLVNLLIFYLGLFFIYKFFYLVLKNKFISIVTALLFFASPMLAYYSNNFISNPAALALTIISWFFFYKYYVNPKIKYFNLFLLFILLASLLKISEAFSLFAITGILILELIGVKFKSEGQIFSQKLKVIAALVLTFILFAGWYIWAHKYNNQNFQTYYIFDFRPIWTLEASTIQKVWSMVKGYWHEYYFHKSALILFGLSFIFNCIFFKKTNKFFFFITLELFVGVVLFLMLWFYNLLNHDYYLISALILPLLSLLVTFDIIIRHYPKIVGSYIFTLSLIVFLGFNVFHSKKLMHARYHGWENADLALYSDLFSISPYLQSIGVKADDKVICLPDQSVNYSLYLINRPGWTEFNGVLNDSATFKRFIDRGAKYLLLIGNEPIQKRQWLKSFATKLVGEYGNVQIFCLSDSCPEAISKKKLTIVCNCEKKEEHSIFYDSTGTYAFNGGKSSVHKAFSGTHSVKLTKNEPYALTIHFDSVKATEQYTVSAWRYSIDKRGTIVACIKSVNDFYINHINVLEKKPEGWEKVALSFNVPSSLNNQKMSINLFYDGDTCVYFDDMRIECLR